jgi:putative acetyltransferase
MNILEGNLDNDKVIALLRDHLAGMHEIGPPGSVYALDLSGLMVPEISFYSAWDEDALLGVGALKTIDPDAGEIKSMRTDAAHVRKGVAAALLEHILAVARHRGYRRLSLETGSGDPFEPALTLYRKYGFANGEAFGSYTKSDFNQFLHLDL